MNYNPMQMVMNIMRMGKNPQQAVEMFVRQNPQANNLLKSIQNSGMTPQAYLDQYAKQNGMTEQVNQMKGMLEQFKKR